MDIKSRTTSKGLKGNALLWWKHCHGETVPSAADIAFRIHEDPTQREILEALIIGECPDATIQDALGIPAESLAVYRELFFDLTQFRNKLALIAYVMECSGIRQQALRFGYSYVLARYFGIPLDADEQRKLVQKMFADAAYTSMSEEENTADYARTALKAYEMLHKTEDKAAGNSQQLCEIILNWDTPPEQGIPEGEEIG